MTVESNYVIAIATLSDWRKRRASVSTNEKPNQNQSHDVRVIFPATLVLGFRQSFENRSNCPVHSVVQTND